MRRIFLIIYLSRFRLENVDKSWNDAARKNVRNTYRFMRTLIKRDESVFSRVAVYASRYVYNILLSRSHDFIFTLSNGIFEIFEIFAASYTLRLI